MVCGPYMRTNPRVQTFSRSGNALAVAESEGRIGLLRLNQDEVRANVECRVPLLIPGPW